MLQGTMYADRTTEKLAYEQQAQCNAAPAVQGCSPDSQLYNRRATVGEEAQKNASFHAEQAQKLSAAADFLRSHPEFDEFIRLIRLGALQF